MKESAIVWIITAFGLNLFITAGCSSEKPVQETSTKNDFQMPNRAPGAKEQTKIERRPGLTIDCIDSSKINPDETCYDLLDPVCGCDSITYSNDCQARKSGVQKWRKGACI